MTDPQQLYGAEYFAGYGNDPKREAMYRQELRRIETMMPDFGQRRRVLDIGCGTGDFLEMFPPTWDKYGIEVSDHARAIAAEKGICMYPYKRRRNYYDLIIFRGSIQHLDTPLVTMKDCVDKLKPGGLMVFLATPNAGSLVYRLWQNLPALHPDYNYVVFSKAMLCNCLRQFGMEIARVEYPYLRTPYAAFWRDLGRFILRCCGIKKPFAWFGNMMEVYARKPR